MNTDRFPRPGPQVKGGPLARLLSAGSGRFRGRSLGLPLRLLLVATIGPGPKEHAATPAGALPAVDASDGGPITMKDLQHLEHLAWLVDTRTAEAETYVEAKFAVLHRPMPDAVIGPVPHLVLPTDELAALERLHGSGHLSDVEYETLRRRVLLRL